MAGGIETFVIHLARAHGRRAQVDSLLSGTPFAASILDAVDGRALTAAQKAEVKAEAALFAPRYPFALNDGEVGCFLSHRDAWQAIVNEDLDAALILEDDVALDAGFAQAVVLAQAHVEALGYIQFQVREVPEAEVVVKKGGVAIVRPEVTPLRTSAQMVSRGAAERLLALSKRIDRPVDTFLQMHWETGLRLCCVVPSGVSDRTAQTGGSTISTKRGLGEKLVREVQRGRYRAAVKRRSKHG